MPHQVAGIDWYRRGWVMTVLGPGAPEVRVNIDLAALIDTLDAPDAIAIDMPIGLPDDGSREADALAKALVGPRRNSVFPTPPKEVLYAKSYETANRIADRVLGKRISKQSYALAANIRIVEELADDRMIEVHPEVSFRELAGEELQWAKTSWNGQMLRSHLLREQAGIELPEDLGPAGAVPVADVLDSAVAAWSARRYARREARSLPPRASRGTRGVIWY